MLKVELIYKNIVPDKLLLNCSFYVEYELVEKTHFLQVFSQYMEILNEITN